MNMAITEGLALMPPAFASGLANWSSGDGTIGSPSYLGAANAALVPSDADFAGCLELQKTTATQRLRCKLATPCRPGLYLRVTVRLKAISGALPSVRLSCLAVNGAGAAIAGLAQTGPEQVLAGYGQVVVLQGILGPGARGGVDLVWGTAPAACHVGIDLTGANGGVLRIDDIEVEDITAAFLRQMMDWVDVRDYGARGDGATDDLAAFQAADAAAMAAGRSLLVSAGSYRINGNLTLSAPVRFEGTLAMAAAHRLALTRSYTLEAYTAAFGEEEAGLRRALQALYHFTDHGVLDLGGRAVNLSAPIFLAEAAGITGSSFVQRRVIDNGQLIAVESAAWTPGVVTATASYSTAAPYTLSGVANLANIEVGALVTGAGVARETYVRSKNLGAGTIELSLPAGSQGGTRSYTFTRFRYMLDFSGFGRLDRMEMTNLEFVCNGRASAILLPPRGITTRIHGCVLNRPSHRGVTSIGTGCQGMMIDECQFLSNEQALRVQDRVTIGFNVNANDVKVRDNRAVRFRHFGVMHGSGHLFVGNHWFQGDAESPGVRSAGVVLTGINIKTLMTGNYVDNSFVELTNEREGDPNWTNQFSFGGLTMTGNIFTANDVVSAFSWIVVTPRGAGHYLQGLSITGNTFRTLNGAIDRVEKVDTTHADLDYSRFRNLTVHGNNFNGVTTGCFNPLTLRHTQNTASNAWSIEVGPALAFSGWARVVTAVLPEGAIRDASNAVRYDLPWAQPEQGPAKQSALLRWPVPVTGRAWVTVRSDSPS